VVQDHGVGIPAADLPKILERYHRGANVSGRFAGPGLGLSGAKEIVEQHGGTLTITSREGEGTTVTVQLLCA
jgi:signal transduction histidine kinase